MKLDAEDVLDAGKHLDREQRVPAEIEELIVDADAVDPEHLAPHFDERLLDRRLRRGI